MSPAVCNELSCLVVIYSNNSHQPTCSEELSTVLNVDRQQLLRFSGVWAWLNRALGLRFADIPERNLAVLAYTEVLICVYWRDWEAVNASHSKSLVWDPLLVLEIPAQDWLISWAGEEVNVVCKYLYLGYLAGVLFQVRDELSWSDLPNSNLSFISSGYNELVIVTQADGSDAVLVSVIDLPKLLIVVHSESSYLSVGPAWKDDLICEQGA